MKSRSYNIVLLPPSKLFRKTIDLSKLLSKKFNTEFTLDGQAKYPHATLYHVQIPDAKYKEFLKALDEIFVNQKKVKSSANRYSTTETFISMNLKKTKNLVDLHKKVIKEINPLREGLVVAKISKDWKVIPKEYRDNLKSYGSLGVLTKFRPHFTITRLKSLKDSQSGLHFLPRLPKQTIVFEKAALGKLGPHGTVTKVMKTYKLN